MALFMAPAVLGGAAAGGAYLKSKWDDFWNPAPAAAQPQSGVSPWRVGAWVLIAFAGVYTVRLGLKTLKGR